MIKKPKPIKFSLNILIAAIAATSTIISSLIFTLSSSHDLKLQNNFNVDASRTYEALNTQLAYQIHTITPIFTISPSPSPSPSSTPTLIRTKLASEIIKPTQYLQIADYQGTEIAFLKTEVGDLKQELTTISDLQEENQKQLLLVLDISNQVKTPAPELVKISSRLTNIEQVIINDPVKALSMTLLAHDVDNLRASFQEEINRLYSQNQWFIGLNITIAVGVLSLAIGPRIPKPGSKPKNDPENTDEKVQIEKPAGRKNPVA